MNKRKLLNFIDDALGLAFIALLILACLV